MYDFRYKRERLKRTRTELLEQQQFGEVVQVAFIRDCEHGAESFQIDVFLAHVVVRRQLKMTRGLQGRFGPLVCELEQRALCASSLRIDKVHDRALMLADDSRVRLGDEVTHRWRVPVITPGHAALIVQSLLDHGPLTVRSHDEVMQVDLKTVSDRVVVDASREPAGPHESVSIEAASLAQHTQLSRSVSRMTAASTTDIKTELVCVWRESALQCAHYRSRDS